MWDSLHQIRKHSIKAHWLAEYCTDKVKAVGFRIRARGIWSQRTVLGKLGSAVAGLLPVLHVNVSVKLAKDLNVKIILWIHILPKAHMKHSPERITCLAQNKS